MKFSFNPISHNVLGIHPPMENPFRTIPPCFFYTQANILIHVYHAKGEVSWFKIVELAADQKSDPSDRNLEKSKNQNLYKENQDPNYSEGRQNLTKVARTL